MRKITLTLMALGTIVNADIFNDSLLYKDPRIMGMGGANVALGGLPTSVFYNPAGLAVLPLSKDKRLNLELPSVTLSISKDIYDFYKEIDKTNNTSEVIDITKKYSGNNFNLNLSSYNSLSYFASKQYIYHIGILGGADLNAIAHTNGGANGVIETHSKAYGGINFAIAKSYENITKLPGKLSVGVNTKFIKQRSYSIGLDAGEILAHKDNFGDYIRNTYEEQNQGFGVDIGILYTPEMMKPMIETLHPTIGLSVMNLGNLTFKNTYGSLPMSANLGITLHPHEKVTIAIDYADLFNTTKGLTRSMTATTQYTDTDINYELSRHVNIGLNYKVLQTKWFNADINTGLYKGGFTFGTAIQAGKIFSFNFSTYKEQLSLNMGEIEDRRYAFNLQFGW